MARRAVIQQHSSSLQRQKNVRRMQIQMQNILLVHLQDGLMHVQNIRSRHRPFNWLARRARVYRKRTSPLQLHHDVGGIKRHEKLAWPWKGGSTKQTDHTGFFMKPPECLAIKIFFARLRHHPAIGQSHGAAGWKKLFQHHRNTAIVASLVHPAHATSVDIALHHVIADLHVCCKRGIRWLKRGTNPLGKCSKHGYGCTMLQLARYKWK